MPYRPSLSIVQGCYFLISQTYDTLLHIYSSQLIENVRRLMALPPYVSLFNDVLGALKRLGGSGSIAEIDEEVIKSLNLSEIDLLQMHDERRTELAYRLAWTRTYLKTYGLLDNSERGIWVLTPSGRGTISVDALDVTRSVRLRNKQKGQKGSEKNTEAISSDASLETVEEAIQLESAAKVVEAEQVLEEGWRDELLGALQAMAPDAFERLCQLLLRESGFDNVRVTGKSGDGGIDGVGVVRLGGLLGFPVLFQCKRYHGSVSSGTVRDFRGALVGRADRGLIITTGTFTRDAQAEAVRDGAPPIDLLDVDQLLLKLKELRLGVNVELVEKVSIRADWFSTI